MLLLTNVGTWIWAELPGEWRVALRGGVGLAERVTPLWICYRDQPIQARRHFSRGDRSLLDDVTLFCREQRREAHQTPRGTVMPQAARQFRLSTLWVRK